MTRIKILSAVLAIGCGLTLVGMASGAPPEWNPVRTHPVEIGPEAGRVIVGFRANAANAAVQTIHSRVHPEGFTFRQAQTSATDVAALAKRTGLAMSHSRQLTPSMHVVHLQKTLYGADVEALLTALRSDPAVAIAAVDQRRYPHKVVVPNDPLFQPGATATGQWFMLTPSPTGDASATDAVSAWDITMGSTGTVIADVDTGVRFDHPDLGRAGFGGGRLLPGYDFVDQDFDPTTNMALGTFLIANDGDGWDPDPSDPGDWINAADLTNKLFPPKTCGDPTTQGPTDSSWHGTRVAGVLGAITNNNAGVAGMTWNPYILPVRALGKCGGYDSDIIFGMEWAAGMAITGVPNNPYPADIINLSLGGAGTCPTTSLYYPVIGTLAGMGVLVVASAGNSSGGAVDEPASCPGVLAVAGLRNVGTKVGYSSMGPQVGIAAPAGNCINSMGTCLRSIDTTVNTGLTVPLANVYTDQNNPNLGTSFSAPIVAGIVGLMRAVNMNLTPAQLITRIKSSATPFPAPLNIPVCPAVTNTGECACPNTGVLQCGAGMANALSAVNEALKPISVITNAGSNTLFDASGSVAACGLTVASYLWTAMGGIAIQGAADAAQVTVAWNGTTVGKLTLKVTDSAGHADNSATVTFDATGAASVHAPSGAGTAASACPTPLTFNAAAPTVSEAFSPASVGPNAASTLTITLTNTNGFALTQSAVTVPVPAGLSIQTMPAAATTCTGGLKTLTSTSGSVSLTGANIPAAGSCTITLSVMSTMAGTYAASIAANALTTGPAGSNAMSASASLNVTAPPGKSGGGGFAWLDVMFLAGVLLVKRTARL